MATLLADGYYLKAMENYPWELSEALENLNYTLSYDPEHAGANCLMGQLQMHYLKNYQAAEEYFEAARKNDIVEVADALGDMLYILCGTIITHGFQNKIEEVFDEIQKSNMSKLGKDGKPIYRSDGKVMKGPDYFKPNIRAILKK